MSFLQLRSIGTRILSFPTVTTQAVTNIASTSGDGNGTLVNTGGSAVTARGFVYSSVNSQPTLADTVVSSGTATGTYTITMSPLSSTTTYYVRAYATNAIGTGYGDTVTFTTTVGGGATVYNSTFMMLGLGM